MSPVDNGTRAGARPGTRPGTRGLGRLAVIGVPYVWLLIFFLLPFLIIVKISVSEMGAVSVNDLVTFKDGVLSMSPRLGNYATVVRDDLYFNTYLSSLKYAAVTTVLCLAIGYPFAYFMARARSTVQPALLMLVMLPFWTSFLLRVYAWKGLLTERGWLFELVTASGLDQLLAAANLIPAPGQLMNTPFSLVVGMTYMYLPFMILPLYSNLSKMDLRLLEAASDLGANAWVAFWTPWNAGVGTVNAAATVASPAAIAPGGITLSGRKVKGVKRLSGRVTQAGAGVATKVTILAGTKRLATVSARANGAFTYAVPKKSKATTFRARAVVAGHDAPAVCGQFGSLGVPCVNATVSGFTATSGAVRIR